jgi:miniconductance mechanosensitive channel
MIKRWLATMGIHNIDDVAADGVAVLMILLLAVVLHLTLGRGLRAAILRFAGNTTTTWDDLLVEYKVVQRLLLLLPTAVIWFGVRALPDVNHTLEVVVERAAEALVTILVARVLDALLRAGHALYDRTPDAKLRPIKGYVQVSRLVLWMAAVLVAVAAIFDKSPLLFLSGIGAMTAVILLVFKDTLLGLVASIQLASNDMVRVGDWIELPPHAADGEVVDIALHTVKVRNWDNTITTVPTWALMSEGFKNWRAMQESGGRRIRRALTIEHSSIRHLDDDEINELRGVRLLTKYLDEKRKQLRQLNEVVPGEAQRVATNMRRLTNIGTYRAYLQAWLTAHPLIHKDMQCMVRQQAPTSDGLPIEVYCFTTTTAWAEYENIQSDIFDHALAVAGEFGLRVYQAPSSADVRLLRGASSTPSTATKPAGD